MENENIPFLLAATFMVGYSAGMSDARKPRSKHAGPRHSRKRRRPNPMVAKQPTAKQVKP